MDIVVAGDTGVAVAEVELSFELADPVVEILGSIEPLADPEAAETLVEGLNVLIVDNMEP